MTTTSPPSDTRRAAGPRRAEPAAAAGRQADRAPLVALLTANAISMTGNTLTMVAVPWFVLETTGSAARMGIAAFFTTLPAIIAAFGGGTIVDRLGFRRMSVAADLASGAAVAAIPALYYTTGLAFWQLLALVFLGALLDAPGDTARAALLPDLAGQAGVRLERANAAAQAITRGSSLLGAPLAGLLIAAFGAGAALAIDAATFAVSAALVLALIPATRAAPAPGPFLDEFRTGLRFVRRSRLIVALVLTVAVTNFLDAPFFAVLLPVYAKEVLDSAPALGVMVAASGGGALAGAVVFGMAGHRLPRRATFVGAFVAAGLPFWALAMRPPFAVTLAVLVLGGLAGGPLNPIMSTVVQERVPAELRGRVFGVTRGIAYVAIPLGMLLAGALIGAAGLGMAALAIAAAYLAATFSMLLIPAFREMET